MKTRLVAGTAGAALIGAAVLAFSLGKHPVVAGTNSAAPISPAFPIESGQTRCQSVSRVPADVSHLRVVLTAIHGPPGDLRVRITTEPGQVSVTGGRRVKPAGLVIRMKSPTTPLHPARICMHYFGQGRVILAGERKRVRDGRRLGVASVVFLRPGLESWAGRRDVIAERYGNAQVGAVGGWALWVAVAAAVVAAALALLWIVFRLDAPALAAGGEPESRPAPPDPGRPLGPGPNETPVPAERAGTPPTERSEPR
jgi:hypothetical protein